MVCPRCISTVKEVLNANNAKFEEVNLGIAHLASPLTEEQNLHITDQLLSHGFEILEDKNDQTIEKIKTILIDITHYDKPIHNVKLSEVLSKELQTDYSSLSKLFSQNQGITIENYFQKQKIEKVKELLSYNELSISEIAYRLDYSNPAHLSSQFKRFTGISPTAYKNQKNLHRKSLDTL